MQKKMISVNHALCTGCLQCGLACSINKTGSANPGWARIHIAKDPENGVLLPIVCRQCNPAPCMEICPVTAIQKSPVTGAMQIDLELCIQCKSCVFACPFGAVSIAPDGTILICDLCGGDPACVKLCKERPENTCAYLSNPRASAIQYVEISAAPRTARLARLKQADLHQQREER